MEITSATPKEVRHVSARLKEWAYAGLAFDLAAAIVAHLAVGDGPRAWGWPQGTGVLWALSYFFWRRLQAGAGAPARTPFGGHAHHPAGAVG